MQCIEFKHTAAFKYLCTLFWAFHRCHFQIVACHFNNVTAMYIVLLAILQQQLGSFFGDGGGDREVGLLSGAVHFVGCFPVLHFEGETVTCDWPSDFGGFAQLVPVLGLEMIALG